MGLFLRLDNYSKVAGIKIIPRKASNKSKQSNTKFLHTAFYNREIYLFLTTLETTNLQVSG
jgi:hypothetical protein